MSRGSRNSNYGLSHGSRSGSESSSSQLPNQSELDWSLAQERRQTLTEWTSQLGRNSDAGNAGNGNDPYSHNSGSQARWGGPGYNGLYKYMSSMDQGQGRGAGSRKATPTVDKQHWSYKTDPSCGHDSELARQEKSRWARIEKGHRNGSGLGSRSGSQQQQPEQVHVSEVECQDIERCFIAADITEDGYLNCEEFKNFMEYRRHPITHREAKKLLAETDLKYHSFIDLDQIMFLVFNCGLTTANERGLNSTEFKSLISRLNSSKGLAGDDSSGSRSRGGQGRGQGSRQGHSHAESRSRHFNQSAVIAETVELDGAISYFEDMALNVQAKASQEQRYDDYRRGLREPPTKSYLNTHKNRRPGPDLDPSDPSSSSDYYWEGQGNYYPPPPGWKNMVLHSQDPSCHQPPVDFHKLKGEWESVTVACEEQKLMSSRQIATDKTESANSIDNISFPQPPPLSHCQKGAKKVPYLGSLSVPTPSDGQSATALPKPTPSKSFATELRQVLRSYKAKADGVDIAELDKDDDDAANTNTGNTVTVTEKVGQFSDPDQGQGQGQLASKSGSTNVIFKSAAKDKQSVQRM